MPGKYARKQRGCLLVVYVETEGKQHALAACVGLREIGVRIGEVKRLFVRSAFRKLGLARMLMARVCDIARELGHTTLRLDTLSHMKPAMALYTSLGWRVIPAYYNNPLKDTIYYELTLSDSKDKAAFAADTAAELGKGTTAAAAAAAGLAAASEALACATADTRAEAAPANLALAAASGADRG